jgi:hypothetical protein
MSVEAAAADAGNLAVLEKYQTENPNLMFIVGRNKNGNIVCYEACIDEATGKLTPQCVNV